MNGLAALAAELENCSENLLEALRCRDPRYLGHLSRRDQLLKAISALGADAASLPGESLNRARDLGELCLAEAQRMRSGILGDLQALRRDQLMARGLGSMAGRHQAMLDVKA
jgi:hypothetical protein